MMDFQHPNVMSLIGVCLDAGPGVSIVMPFMANGSLLDYLKKEREKIYLPDTSELEDVSQFLVQAMLIDFMMIEWHKIKGTLSKKIAVEDVPPDCQGNGISCTE